MRKVRIGRFEIKRWKFWIMTIVIVFLGTLACFWLTKLYTEHNINQQLANMNITDEIILKVCDRESDYDKVLCLNSVYQYNVIFKTCENRSIFHLTQQPLETFMLGTGCCRDAAVFYAHYLDQWDIDYLFVYYDIDGVGGHVYVLATLVDNGMFYEIRLENDNLMVQTMVSISELNGNK